MRRYFMENIKTLIIPALYFSLVLSCSGVSGGSSSSSSSSTSSMGPLTNTYIQISGFAFNPATYIVPTNTTVSWTNFDGVNHKVSNLVSVESFVSPSLGNGAGYSFTFTVPGTNNYECTIHPSMKGKVIVTN
jgi:plastocyanin